MRITLPLAALIISTGAAPPSALPAQDQGLQGRIMPAPRAAPRGEAPNAGGREVCLDRIEQVRRESGQPALDRDASPEQPLFIAAVDKRIGGCAVMVMRNDTSDVRPLPAPGEFGLRPAR